MMNALVKQAKDTVLEKFLEGTNEETSEEEEAEITKLAQEELNATNDPDLKETKPKPKKPTGKSKVNSNKSKKKSTEAVVDQEGGDNMKVPTKKGANATASSSKASTTKNANDVASSSKASKIIDAPTNVDSEGNDSDLPLSKKFTARRIVVDSEGEEETTIGKGKQPAGKGKKPAGSKAGTKRKASDVISDEQAASKEVDSTGPPPSKKTKRTDKKSTKAEKPSTSRMMREGAQWKAKKEAEAVAAAAFVAAIVASSSGTTVAPPVPAPLPPGTLFLLIFYS